MVSEFKFAVKGFVFTEPSNTDQVSNAGSETVGTVVTDILSLHFCLGTWGEKYQD